MSKKRKGAYQRRRITGYLYSDTAVNVDFQTASEDWLDHIQSTVKPSTFSNYTYLIRKHILPYFAKLPLRRLTQRELEGFMHEKLTNGRLKRRGGVSVKYLKDMVSLVKAVAAFGEQRYGIVSSIRYSGSVRLEKKDISLPTKTQRGRLRDSLLRDKSLATIGILIAMYTGMRIGEVCGLRWEDVDLRRGVIFVRRTVQRISDNRGRTALVVGTPKTTSSARSIPIAPELKERLRAAERTRGYVASGTDKPAEPATLRRRFLSFLRRTNLPPMRFHALRHLFASSCIEQRFDISAVSELLGHSNKSMTLDLYVHSSMETKKRYMHRFKL